MHLVMCKIAGQACLLIIMGAAVARGDLSGFEQGLITGAYLASVSASETARLNDVTQAAESRVMWACKGMTSSGKDSGGHTTQTLQCHNVSTFLSKYKSNWKDKQR